MPVRRILALCALAVFAALDPHLSAGAAAVPSADAAAPSTEANQVIERLHGSLLGVMKDGGALGYQGRYDKLSPVISRSFNLRQMAQMSIGPYWSKLDAQQRQALVDSFTRLTVATYANRFDHDSGLTFRLTGEPQQRGDALLVQAEIRRSDGEVIPITYYMRHFDAGWQTVDVFLKGVISEMATKRSEYSSVLQHQGLEGLIRVIDEKAKSFAGSA